MTKMIGVLLTTQNHVETAAPKAKSGPSPDKTDAKKPTSAISRQGIIKNIEDSIRSELSLRKNQPLTVTDKTSFKTLGADELSVESIFMDVCNKYKITTGKKSPITSTVGQMVDWILKNTTVSSKSAKTSAASIKPSNTDSDGKKELSKAPGASKKGEFTFQNNIFSGEFSTKFARVIEAIKAAGYVDISKGLNVLFTNKETGNKIALAETYGGFCDVTLRSKTNRYRIGVTIIKSRLSTQEKAQLQKVLATK